MASPNYLYKQSRAPGGLLDALAHPNLVAEFSPMDPRNCISCHGSQLKDGNNEMQGN